MHHHQVRLRLLQPPDQLILSGNVGGQEAAVALVRAVVLEAAALGSERADEFDVFGEAGFI
jgi:hypothetical protein